MRVIAISGWKQSGKDTIAEYLGAVHKYTRFGFADVLKDMVAEQYDIPRQWLDDPEYKEKALLQYPVKDTDKFTSKIHEILKNEFAVVKTEWEDECEFTSYWTPRSLAILEGSIKRSVDSSYWVKRVIENIQHEAAPTSTTESFVISDLRYRSEVAQLREAFGDNLITVRVNRFDSLDTTDPSERDLDNSSFDVVLDNKGSLANLVEQIEEKLIK